MGRVNTGMQRGASLTVAKKVNGKDVEGYPRVYHVTDAFLNYTPLTDGELERMVKGDYLARLAAFTQYVGNVEIGITISTESAYRTNTGACPINK